MATLQRLQKLWTHRYHKYGHIAGKYLSVQEKIWRLRLRKATLGGRPLVAIVLSEQFGDIVACEPVAREVRRLHPTGHIIWVVRQAYAELVAHHPDLNGYVVEKCPAERVHLLDSGVFDVVYNLHLSHRKCRYCAEDPINPIADRLGIDYSNYYFFGNLLHVFSQAAGLPPLEDQPRLYIQDADRQRVDALPLPEGAVVVHCQSSYAPRDWPAANWNQLVRTLIEQTDRPVVEIGLKPVITTQHPRLLNLCGQLSLLETAEVIRRSPLFVGIDSGPAHLANAVETDGIILLGKTHDFVEYMPYSGRYKRGEGVQILNYVGHPCAELPYDWVEQAVLEKIRTLTPANGATNVVESARSRPTT